jgi:hypothetical protein
MHPKTKELKRRLKGGKSLRDKLEILHNAYQGEEAFVCTCGPSLKSIDQARLSKCFKGRLVFSVKQAFDFFPEETDFHLVNDVNHKRYAHKDSTIVVFEKSWSPRQVYGPEPDLLLSLDPALKNIDNSERYKHWLVNTREFDKYKLSVQPLRPWGPSILIEVGMYLWLHLGLSKVICLGWDVGNASNHQVFLKHFYDQNSGSSCSPILSGFRSVLDRCPPSLKRNRLYQFVRKHRYFFDYLSGDTYHVLPTDKGENASIIAASEHIYLWLRQNGIKLELGTSGSLLSPIIPRIPFLTEERT